MKARGFDPQRLDVEALARAGATVEARWPIAQLERLAAAAHPDVPLPPAADVAAKARGERVERTGHEPQHWLHLEARASLALVCQRCLAPVDCELHVQRRILFVAGEDRAESLDAELDDDVLALTRSLDLRELVEDELLLDLPLVPRHERCPQPLLAPPPAGADEVSPTRQRPFAGLRAMRDAAGGGGAPPEGTDTP